MSKADDIVALIEREPNLNSFQIAERLDCHPGFVRATEQRRITKVKKRRKAETDYSREYYRSHPERREKQAASAAARYQVIRDDPKYKARRNWNRKRFYHRKVHGIDIGEWKG